MSKLSVASNARSWSPVNALTAIPTSCNPWSRFWAQKRDQGLQDVGIAVSAFTGDQLRAFDATDSFDIAAYTPGVHISGNLAGQNTQFTIRGVTQNDFNDIIESPIAVYLDEGPHQDRRQWVTR